jgi:hypothetical protein
MQPESDESVQPLRGEPDNQASYEPPTIRDLGSLRDLVAAAGNTIDDGHGLGPGQ